MAGGARGGACEGMSVTVLRVALVAIAVVAVAADVVADAPRTRADAPRTVADAPRTVAEAKRAVGDATRTVATAVGGAVQTEDYLAKYSSVWGHDAAAGGVERVADGDLARLDLLKAVRNHTQSSRCRRALDAVLEARTHLKMWALKMEYSSVALPDAVLSATMSSLGDFDTCTSAAPDAMYCLLDVEIRPLSAVGAEPHVLDEKSPFDFPNGVNATLWDVLRTSGNRRRYRRDSQQWAVCLPRDCGPDSRRGVRNPAEDLGAVMAAAVSPLARTLGVHLRVHLDPADCYAQPDAGGGPTSLTATLNRPVFLSVSFCLLLFPALALIASLKEALFDREDDVKGRNGALQSILSCFSVQKNTRALFIRKHSSKINSIEGLRVLGMVLVIAGHRTLFSNMVPIFNPELYENGFSEPLTMMTVNGNAVVTGFFVIAAFLEARAWLVTFDKRNLSLVLVLQAVVARWLRLVPALAAMIAFDAQWLEHLGSGPVWNQQVVRGPVAGCKAVWWANLLFINNYYRPGGAMCLLQSWFLSVVMHLTAVTPFAMWAVHRLSRSSPWPGLGLLALLLAAACLALYACTAALGLLPAISVFPMVLRRANLVFDRNLELQYLPTHTNAISYVVGLIAGALVYFARKQGWSPSRSGRRALFVGIPMGMVLMQVTLVLGVVYLLYTGERPWLEALWGPARILAFSSPVAWAIVACALGCGGVIDRFLSLTPMVALGRLTYSAYLSHASLIFATSGYVRQPFFVSNVGFLHSVAGDVVFSFALAYVLYACVEAPALNLLMMAQPVATRDRATDSRDSPTGTGLGGDSISTLDTATVESQVSKL